MSETQENRKPTRGERSNNPGNIRECGIDAQWVGERATDDDKAFEEFAEPIYGIRALAKILLAYQTKYNLHTIEELVNRWAPPVENNTSSYVNSVCKQTGFAADEALYLRDPGVMEKLVKAIIVHENGRCIYDDKLIAGGVTMALRRG